METKVSGEISTHLNLIEKRGSMSLPNIKIRVYRGYTHGELIIPPTSPVGFVAGDLVRKILSERGYDPRFKRWFIQKQYMHYDTRTSALKVPIAFLDDFIEAYKTQTNVDIEERKINDYPLRKIETKMNPKFQDREWQIEIIKKCSEPVPGMKGLALQTGKGKTYSATTSMINLGYAGIIIVEGLVNQWIDSIREQTDVGDRIYKIEGFKSVADLMLSDYKPDIIVASLGTMRLFCKGDSGYQDLPMDLDGFFRYLGIGTKVFDEVHKAFHAQNQIDLRVNVPYNLYSSATFTQTNSDARRIFDKVYPVSMRHGINNYDKYVTTYTFGYRGEVMERHVCRMRGYSHPRYEGQLLIKEAKFKKYVNECIIPKIDAYFINRYKPGCKMLIFASTRQFVDKMVAALQSHYEDKIVNAYVEGSSDDVLIDSDIIISTLQKASTGLDVKGLITALNTVSMMAPILPQQMLGRLRKIDGQELIYLDQYDMNLESHIRHATARFEQLKQMSLKYEQFLSTSYM